MADSSLPHGVSGQGAHDCYMDERKEVLCISRCMMCVLESYLKARTGNQTNDLAYFIINGKKWLLW